MKWWQGLRENWRRARQIARERDELETVRIAHLDQRSAALQEIAEAHEQLNRERHAAAFYRAWFEGLNLPLPEPPEKIAGWGPGQQQTLLAFLNGPVGQVWFEQARHVAANLAVHAISGELSADKRQQACGMAAGFRAAAAYLVMLSSANLTPQEQETAPDDSTGDQPARARMSL